MAVLTLDFVKPARGPRLGRRSEPDTVDGHIPRCWAGHAQRHRVACLVQCPRLNDGEVTVVATIYGKCVVVGAQNVGSPGGRRVWGHVKGESGKSGERMRMPFIQRR
jgi:hypothetical protein